MKTKVPDVEGFALAKAVTKLRRSGFELQITKRYSNQREGVVLAVRPNAGARLEEGSTIRITVARTFPTIPNVVGQKLKAARRALDKRGFDVKVARRTSTQPKDTVISESPTGGTKARPGRMVTVVVAKPARSTGGNGGSNCTSGYSPCLVYHGGADYDCAGGSGDGPYYTQSGVVYTVTGSDLYGLDADNDGQGCE